MYIIPDAPPQEMEPWFDALPPLALIELDRLCDRCGYNLRGQQVRRDDRTGLLLSRCPECGGFIPANDNKARPIKKWSKPDRSSGGLSAVLLLLWFSGVGLSVAMIVASIEMLFVYSSAVNAYEFTLENAHWLLMHLAVTTLVGAVIGQLISFFEPRWGLVRHLSRGVMWYAPTLGIGMLIATSYATRFGAHDVDGKYFGAVVVVMHAAVFLLGCAAMWAVGRRISRLLVRAMIHPHWRGAFAVLWFLDHLPPPFGVRSETPV